MVHNPLTRRLENSPPKLFKSAESHEQASEDGDIGGGEALLTQHLSWQQHFLQQLNLRWKIQTQEDSHKLKDKCCVLIKRPWVSNLLCNPVNLQSYAQHLCTQRMAIPRKSTAGFEYTQTHCAEGCYNLLLLYSVESG